MAEEPDSALLFGSVHLRIEEPYFFFRRFRPFLERALCDLLVCSINSMRNLRKMNFKQTFVENTSRAKVHPAATSFYKNLHQNDKRTGGIYMDSTHSPHLKDKKKQDIAALMELSEEERHDLLLLAAGMNIAKSLTTKKE